MHEEVKYTASILNKGKVILTPTDTIWGLSTLYDNEVGLERIKEIKHRPPGKFFILLIPDASWLNSLVSSIPEKAQEYILGSDKPTTVVYPGGIDMCSALLGEGDTVAIRIVKEGFCHELLNELGKPIVSTSANVSGDPSPTVYSDISEPILSGVDYVVNWQRKGDAQVSSRIVRCNSDGTVEVLRP